MVKSNVDPVLWHVPPSCAGCDVGADGSWRSVWVRMAAMSSSVADGVTLIGDMRKNGSSNGHRKYLSDSCGSGGVPSTRC